MGQTARLRLIRDRFIAGHNSCDLRRHLDSAPPETPIRDVVDRCRVWESHADPVSGRMRKPTTDPMYPAFTVGEGEVPNPKPEIPDIQEQLQQLLRESVPNTLEQTLRSLFDGQRQRQRQPPRLRQKRRDWSDAICFSCGRLGHKATSCVEYNGTLPFLQPGWRSVKSPSGVTMIPPQIMTDRQWAGKRRMIRQGGSASRVSTKARPRDPGGGTVSTDPRRRIVLYDVIVSVEQPREEPTLVSHTDSTAQTGQALAEDTHIQECSHDVVGLYAHKGTMWITDDCVSQKNIKLPCGGGALTLPGAAGGLLAMFPVASALPIDEPQLDSWQVIVVRVVIHRTGVGRWI